MLLDVDVKLIKRINLKRYSSDLILNEIMLCFVYFRFKECGDF